MYLKITTLTIDLFPPSMAILMTRLEPLKENTSGGLERSPNPILASYT